MKILLIRVVSGATPGASHDGEERVHATNVVARSGFGRLRNRPVQPSSCSQLACYQFRRELRRQQRRQYGRDPGDHSAGWSVRCGRLRRLHVRGWYAESVSNFDWSDLDECKLHRACRPVVPDFCRRHGQRPMPYVRQYGDDLASGWQCLRSLRRLLLLRQRGRLCRHFGLDAALEQHTVALADAAPEMRKDGPLDPCGPAGRFVPGRGRTRSRPDRVVFDRICVDHRIMGGVPSVCGTRIPVTTVDMVAEA